MRRLTLALLLLPGCLGPHGPDLPDNVGLSHAHGSGAETNEPAPEPVDVGTAVWANFRATGFYFRGVVVERREDEHRIVYADGATEWVGADALRPDSLREEAPVHVRPGYEGEFAEGVVARRLGDAIYVHFASGEEGWTALPHVRFQGDDEGVPRRGDEPVAAAPDGVEVGATVLVNYHSQGLLFAGIVTARGDNGRLHVVYLDGEREWIDPSLVRADTLAEGDTVHVRRRYEPAEWVRGRIRQRLGDAIRVELDDGGLAWTSLFRVRAPAAREGAANDADARDSDDSDAPGPDAQDTQDTGESDAGAED